MPRKNRFNREVRPRHYFYAWLNRLVVANIIRSKYRYKGEEIVKELHTPHLVLCNHQSELDPFLLYFVYKAPLYIIANEQIVTNPYYGRLLKHFMNTIPIKKGTIDINVIRRMKDVVMEGGSVAVFPEANSTYDGQTCFNLHNPGKLAKLLGVDVIIYNINGAYFSNPRWSAFRKRGPTRGKMRLVISKEEVASTPLEELETIIRKNLSVDPYENDGALFKGDAIAEGLERLFFFCPKCHHHHVLESRGDILFCKNCDFEGKYDERGYLTIDNKPYQLHEIARPMIDEYEKYVIANANEIFSEDVDIKVCWGNKRRRYYAACTFSLNRDGVNIVGKTTDFTIPFSDLRGYGCQQKRKLVLYSYSLPTIIIKMKPTISIYQYYITLKIFENIKKKGIDNYAPLSHRKLSF
ncbi:MAG: lysophospholipid acyltransferase family protein [Bacilli bacterium]|jgi:1-acyl-sn-glycerol-3-phosphate acyltransferase